VGGRREGGREGGRDGIRFTMKVDDVVTARNSQSCFIPDLCPSILSRAFVFCLPPSLQPSPIHGIIEGTPSEVVKGWRGMLPMRELLLLLAAANLCWCTGSAAQDERFEEDMLIRPLPDGTILTHMTLRTSTGAAGHYGMFPKVVGEIIDTCGVGEFHVKFSGGQWVGQRWGSTRPSPHHREWSCGRSWCGRGSLPQSRAHRSAAPASSKSRGAASRKHWRACSVPLSTCWSPIRTSSVPDTRCARNQACCVRFGAKTMAKFWHQNPTFSSAHCRGKLRARRTWCVLK
jgi:hypothetical protein